MKYSFVLLLVWSKLDAFFTCLALSTNFNVLIVSYTFLDEGDIAPIMKVFVLPSKESCKSLVSFDSRKKVVFLYGPFESEYITFPRVVNDKLMHFSSSKCILFIFYFLFIFSDPAKSHKLRLDFYRLKKEYRIAS